MVRAGEYHVLNKNEAHPHLDRYKIINYNLTSYVRQCYSPFSFSLDLFMLKNSF